MTPRPNPALGVLLVLRGRKDAIEQFGTTVTAFLSSLAPLLAFPIAGALIALTQGGWLEAAATVALSLIIQLTPPVVSYQLARRWGREDQWLRFAIACNWCFWILPMMLAVLALGFGVAVGLGFPDQLAAKAIVTVVVIYSLWLHWFLARNGLGVSRWRAIGVVVAINLLTLLFIEGPAQLG